MMDKNTLSTLLPWSEQRRHLPLPTIGASSVDLQLKTRFATSSGPQCMMQVLTNTLDSSEDSRPGH